MIWADKLACVWAVFIYGALFLFSGAHRDAWFTGPGLWALFQILYTFVLPPWLLLRLLGWLVARRRGQFRYTVLR